MRTTLVGGRVLTPDGFEEDLCVTIEGERIVAVGDPPEGEIVELRGSLLVPGFVDTTARSPARASRWRPPFATRCAIWASTWRRPAGWRAFIRRELWDLMIGSGRSPPVSAQIWRRSTTSWKWSASGAGALRAQESALEEE
jgi:hypothetical protein